MVSVVLVGDDFAVGAGGWYNNNTPLRVVVNFGPRHLIGKKSYPN